MRSFIKIYGPPVVEAIRALERIAVDVPEVCIMDTIISREIPPGVARDIGFETVRTYFGSAGVAIPTERCHNIFSRSGETLGDYDFFFEWFEEPSGKQLHELIEKVDGALAPLGCLYTITTRK